MLDLVLAAFVILFLGMGLKRPFIWVLAYLYVDIDAPQKASYALLTHVQLSLVVFVLAVVGWALFDNKQGTRVNYRQALIAMLLIYAGITTMSADFPVPAQEKWAWVWKGLVFALFLPLTLRTRLRLEASALIMTLSVAAIVLSGAIKTLFSGGGYGTLKLFINENTGLFEGSTISTVAIAIIPMALWLAKHGTIFKPDIKVKVGVAGLIVGCLLIPIGTEARTGLMCAGLLAVLLLRSVKQRAMYAIAITLAVVVAAPLMPTTFLTRMGTIQDNKSDESASTRMAVWGWTIGYAADHPLGGGFDSYRSNRLRIETQSALTNTAGTQVEVNETVDQGRAFHSAYFEMLGEQGWPGLVLWLVIQITGITQLEGVVRRLRGRENARDQSDRALATALEQSHLVYLFGAIFVGIAYLPFAFMVFALEMALVEQVKARLRQEKAVPNRQLVVPPGAMGPSPSAV